MKEDKEYPEISRGAKKSFGGKNFLTLSMILLTVLMTIGLLTSMHFEFEVGADGGKRLTVDFARDRSEPPPEFKTVEPAKEVKTAAQLIEEARSLTDTGFYKNAFDSCNEALKLEPNNMTAYLERGRALYYLSKYHAAIADLDKAIEAGVPELAVAYNARGCAYLYLKEYKRALVDLEEATKLDPNFRKPYLNRMHVYSRLIDVERAMLRNLY